MKRPHLLLASLLAGAAACSAAAGAQAAQGSARLAKAAKVQLRSTSKGKILVSSAGFTLYRFTKDPRNKDTCVTTKGCAEVWPALTTSARPSAGAGVKASLLSTITLSGARKQVTYGGYPLYLYKPASERGETSYIGFKSFGGTWDAVDASGKLVK
jgi:predicted lipoprotein with Yx(FWY)xxD motif